MGRTVFSYAQGIFSLGSELMDTVRNRPTGRPMQVDFGVVDVLPKLIAQWLIEPAPHLRKPVELFAERQLRISSLHDLRRSNST